MTQFHFVDVADAIATHLRSASIPGLTTLTAEEVDALASPPAGVSAIVISSGESVRERRSTAYTATQAWTVYLTCRSALGKTQVRDGQALQSVINALHGMPVPGGQLDYQGFQLDPGAPGGRLYRIQFQLSAVVVTR